MKAYSLTRVLLIAAVLVFTLTEAGWFGSETKKEKKRNRSEQMEDTVEEYDPNYEQPADTGSSSRS